MLLDLDLAVLVKQLAHTMQRIQLIIGLLHQKAIIGGDPIEPLFLSGLLDPFKGFGDLPFRIMHFDNFRVCGTTDSQHGKQQEEEPSGHRGSGLLVRSG